MNTHRRQNRIRRSGVAGALSYGWCLAPTKKPQNYHECEIWRATGLRGLRDGQKCKRTGKQSDTEGENRKAMISCLGWIRKKREACPLFFTGNWSLERGCMGDDWLRRTIFASVVRGEHKHLSGCIHSWDWYRALLLSTLLLVFLIVAAHIHEHSDRYVSQMANFHL